MRPAPSRCANRGMQEPRYFVVINADSTVAPPFAVMQISGLNSDGIVTVVRPTIDSQPNGLLINGPGPIPVGGKGQGHNTYPCVAAYSQNNSTNANPAEGEFWGTKSGKWELHKDQTGFRVIGTGGRGLCNVMRQEAKIAEAFYHRTTYSASLTSDGTYVDVLEINSASISGLPDTIDRQVLLILEVTGVLQVQTSSAKILGRLYNNTTSGVVTNSSRTLCYADAGPHQGLFEYVLQTAEYMFTNGNYGGVDPGGWTYAGQIKIDTSTGDVWQYDGSAASIVGAVPSPGPWPTVQINQRQRSTIIYEVTDTSVPIDFTFQAARFPDLTATFVSASAGADSLLGSEDMTLTVLIL